MDICQRYQTYTLCLMIIILPYGSIHSEDICGDVDLKRLSQTGLSESQFWSSKSQDFEQCAKLCIRQKTCRSITYDTKSQMCEMNTGTISDTPKRTGGTLAYSEFDWWPASLDKNCYSRPCDDSESCIPGSMLGVSTGCSYSCGIFSRDVCPLPPWGVTNGRTVGSVNSYKCENGTIGGGTATCLASKQWDKDISPTCTEIYGHSCNNDASDPCHLIGGECSAQGKCDCGNFKSYNASIKECFLDCGDPTQVENADLQGNTNTRTYQCHTDYYPTATSNATLTCTENGWVPVNGFSCYTCGEPGQVDGATLYGSGQERKYKCDDVNNDAQHLYPVPGTGDGKIVCDEDSTAWKPTGFKCGGLRLKQSHPKMLDIPNSGYLEMFADGEWRAVTYETWDWRRTKVACRKLFGFEFGGTFHEDWFDDDNPQRLLDAYKLDNIDCTGNEDSLEQCPDFNNKNGDIDKEIALTCFNYNIFESGIVRLEPGSRRGAVIVKIGSDSGGVCGEGWDDKVTKVVCRTIDSEWERDGECKSDCGLNTDDLLPLKTDHIDCKGDEPHLFYCENKGWGNYTAVDCDLSKIAEVRCDS